MRKILFVLFVFSCAFTSAQTKILYYDFNWKPCEVGSARFYSTVEKTDSGWFRNDYYINTRGLQMRGLYEDEACKVKNGSFVYVHPNNRVSEIVSFRHGKRNGVDMFFYQNGMMADSGFYTDGRLTGNRAGWYRNGFLMDTLYSVNDSMSIQIGYFDDGAISYAGYLLKGEYHGKWKYYHHNGQLSAIEIFESGKALGKTYFKEDGTALLDTSGVNSECVFKKGGAEGWQRYLESKADWPNGYKIVNTDQVTVGVEYTVDEEGNIENAEISTPFTPEFDNAALTVVRSSPKWIPRVAHNRKVKQSFRQPITFAQQED